MIDEISNAEIRFTPLMRAALDTHRFTPFQNIIIPAEESRFD